MKTDAELQRAVNLLLLDYVKRTRPWWKVTIAELERRLENDDASKLRPQSAGMEATSPSGVGEVGAQPGQEARHRETVRRQAAGDARSSGSLTGSSEKTPLQNADGGEGLLERGNGSTCTHAGYILAEHGRFCPCGAKMFDFGD